MRRTRTRVCRVTCRNLKHVERGPCGLDGALVVEVDPTLARFIDSPVGVFLAVVEPERTVPTETKGREAADG